MEFEEFTVSEIDFLTKQQSLTTIQPSYTEERGDFGPFKPNIPEEVPLWLALHLKRSNKCRIVPPNWLSVEVLTDVFAHEKDNEDLQILPFQFFETAHILLKSCSDTIPNIQKVKSIMEDIEDIRQTKIDKKMAKIDQKTKFVKFNNISQFEINKRRKVLELFMGGLSNVRKVVEKNDIDVTKLTLSQNLSQQSQN